MSDRINLTLPSKAPEMERYHHSPERIVDFALYTLVDLSDEEVSAICKICDSECLPENVVVKPAPEYRYIGGPLRKAFDYHLQLGRGNEYDPRWFVAVTDKEWKTRGVLLVTLDDDDLECNTDSFFIKAEESGIWLINLQIANTDWAEVKEGCSLGLPGELDNDEPTTVDDSKPIYDDGAPRKKPLTGFYIGFYLLQGIDPDEFIRQVQPFASQQPSSQYACRIEGHLQDKQNLLGDAASLHPQRCKDNPFLHRRMFFVASTLNYLKEGLSWCRIDWDDTGLSDKSMRELKEKGVQAKRESKSVVCDVHTLVPNFCGCARGTFKWDG